MDGSDLDNLLDDGLLDEGLLDDFVFEPKPWDFGVEIGMRIGFDDECDPPALEDLADALLFWAEGPELERLTDEAVERIWDDELARLVREGIVRLASRDEWSAAAVTVLAEFDRDPRSSEVAREVVRYLAMQAGTGPPFCVDCVESGISNTSPPTRRTHALLAAFLAARCAAVPAAELRAALADALIVPPAVRLATVARRQAVRAHLGRLGELGTRSVPLLAAELRSIASEALPNRAEDDDVWQAVCTFLLEQEARPAMN